jgi:flagellar basal-body rod protein FlgC
VFQTERAGSPFSAAFQMEVDREPGLGVVVAEVIEDPREPDKRYQPGHPDADASGYVAYPRMSPAEEMVDLMSASRGYGANVSAMLALKDMISRSIDILR